MHYNIQIAVTDFTYQNTCKPIDNEYGEVIFKRVDIRILVGFVE